MKTTCIAILCIILSITVNANSANPEEQEVLNKANLELRKLIDDFFVMDTGLIRKENPEMKIIILNNDFRKVREDNISSMKEINSESTLVPVIYRTEFIATIYNVSYFILKD